VIYLCSSNTWLRFALTIAFHRPDTLDPALLRPGRLDRRVEFSLPDNEGRAHILKIHARSMSVERNIRYDLIARLCPNSTGAELRSVCTEAGMFAIRARRKVASEKDFLDAVEKVIKQGSKFSSTGLYAVRFRICDLCDSLGVYADRDTRFNRSTTRGRSIRLLDIYTQHVIASSCFFPLSSHHHVSCFRRVRFWLGLEESLVSDGLRLTFFLSCTIWTSTCSTLVVF
jgi:hypothetical protein